MLPDHPPTSSSRHSVASLGRNNHSPVRRLLPGPRRLTTQPVFQFRERAVEHGTEQPPQLLSKTENVEMVFHSCAHFSNILTLAVQFRMHQHKNSAPRKDESKQCARRSFASAPTRTLNAAWLLLKYTSILHRNA